MRIVRRTTVMSQTGLGTFGIQPPFAATHDAGMRLGIPLCSKARLLSRPALLSVVLSRKLFPMSGRLNPNRSRTILSTPRIMLLGAVVLFAAGLGLAQFRRSSGGGDSTPGGYARTEGGGLVNEDTVRTARETESHSTGTPNWTNAAGFSKDVFTFARIIFKSHSGLDGRFSRGSSFWGWSNDYPDSDLNLSYRLQQLTSLKVDPDGRVLTLTDPDLCDYPFIYMVKPGRLELRAMEVPLLRRYLLNGGSLMADDFWGTQEWENFEREMDRVLPGIAG